MSVATLERKIEGVNRSELARECGLTRSYVSQVLNGKREPGISVARTVAKKLGVTVDVFADYLDHLERKALVN